MEGPVIPTPAAYTAGSPPPTRAGWLSWFNRPKLDWFPCSSVDGYPFDASGSQRFARTGFPDSYLWFVPAVWRLGSIDDTTPLLDAQSWLWRQTRLPAGPTNQNLALLDVRDQNGMVRR